jgi:hypothetical protein
MNPGAAVEGAAREGKLNTKLQAPEKLQIPNFNPRRYHGAFKLQAWCLMFGASLELGVWSLELGAS